MENYIGWPHVAHEPVSVSTAAVPLRRPKDMPELVWRLGVLETGGSLSLWPIAPCTLGKEPVDYQTLCFISVQNRGNGAANQRTTTAKYGNRLLIGPGSGKQLLFCVAASVPQRNALPGIKIVTSLL